MVGILVVGLIGGVIASTVFAVIPWSQDNAAKEQLQSINTAQNAHYGLSSDPSAPLGTGAAVDSFTSSAGLANAKLLGLGSNYCTNPILNGQDYQAFVQSGSGKIFVSTNSNKTPYNLSSLTTLPCDATTGNIDPVALTPYKDDPKVFPGNSGQSLVNDYGIPVGTTVYSENFESYTYRTQAPGWTQSGMSDTWIKTPAYGVSSTDQTHYTTLYSGWNGGNVSKVYEFGAAAGNPTDYFGSPSIDLKPGTYNASGLTAKSSTSQSWANWTLSILDSKDAIVGTVSWSESAAYKWTTHGANFTVPTEGTYRMKWTGNGQGQTYPYQMVDDVKIVKTGNI